MTEHDWNDQYCNLTKHDRADPLGQLWDVAGHLSLFDHRRELFHWLTRVMTCKESEGDIASERCEQLWVFQLTIKALEMMHIISSMVETEKLTYSYKPVDPKE